MKPNAQTQALVSQLVRKEFEKSLGSVEFPNGGEQDIYFIPNANQADFLMCLGLEEVVKCVQEHLNNKSAKAQEKVEKEKEKEREKLAGEAGVKEEKEKEANTAPTTTTNIIEIKYDFPAYCSQCYTDFTPVWRTDKNGAMLCERCLKVLEKKQAKMEHIAKLKQLFNKSLKDRDVFEKQVLAEQQAAATAAAAAAAAQQQQLQQQQANQRLLQQQQQQQAAQARFNNNLSNNNSPQMRYIFSLYTRYY